MAKSKGILAESPSSKPENDYEADSALDTLSRAEEIKADKHMMKRVAKKAGRKVKALHGLSAIIEKHGPKKPRSISDLRKISNDMAMEKGGEDEIE